MSRILLLSTYELGEQPLGLVGPATALLAAGHDVRVCDLSVEEWPVDALDWSDAVACSVPMHTAFRLATGVVQRVRNERPGLPVGFYGMYAGVADEIGAARPGDLVATREVAPALVAWADRIGPGTADTPATLPVRAVLPGLSNYARLITAGGERLVGAVESTEGCNHRCRHCPVPVVYDGRSRPVDLGEVLADVDELVAAGAGHIHFADPDFLNRPQHARRVAAGLHERHREVSFDATVKVSHLLRQRDLIAELASMGLLFIISAFESTSDLVLHHLRKGHSAGDLGEAVAVLRSAGVEPRPSLLPFTPWTTRDDLVSMLDFVAGHDLVDNVDAVQYGIRLLLPPGSLLLGDPDETLAESIVGFDADALGTAWRAADPRLDELQAELAALIERAATEDAAPADTYAEVRSVTFRALGRRDPGTPIPVAPLGPPGARPRLSEPWFCCAEPTTLQLEHVNAEPEWVPVNLGVRTGGER